MPYNTPIDRTIKEVNKIFESFDSKCVKVSEIISKLDLSFIQIEQRKSEFSIESYLKLYLYKRIKGINSNLKLLEELNKEEAFSLGFTKGNNDNLNIPTRQGFNKFIREKLTLEIKLLLEDITKHILKTATDKGILLDIELVKNTIKGRNKESNDKAFKEAIKLVKKLVYPQIEIPIKHNAKFTTKDLLDVLVHVAYSHDFANNGSKTFSEINQDSKVPSGDTLIYHFGKLRFRDEIQETFRKIFDVILEFAKKNYNILNQRKVNIAYCLFQIFYATVR